METKDASGTYLISLLVACLAAVAAAGGLLLDGLYRDSEFIKAAWLGNDLVTLLFAVPTLMLVLFLYRRGSERARLIRMGLLAYMAYNYAFYLFGAAFNWFFLIYVALFSLSSYALILGLRSICMKTIQQRFKLGTPVKPIGVFLLLISVPLAIIEIMQCVSFIVTGKVPEPPTPIFALDLSIVVPCTAAAGILLWKRRAWGYVLASIMLVKAAAYGLVLCTSTALLAGVSPAGPWDPLMPFYVFVAVGGLCGCILLLKNLEHISEEN